MLLEFAILKPYWVWFCIKKELPNWYFKNESNKIFFFFIEQESNNSTDYLYIYKKKESDNSTIMKSNSLKLF